LRTFGSSSRDDAFDPDVPNHSGQARDNLPTFGLPIKGAALCRSNIFLSYEKSETVEHNAMISSSHKCTETSTNGYHPWLE